MAIVAKASRGGTFIPCPSGNQAAICVDVVDHSLVKSEFYKNDDGTDKWQHKVSVVWESSELMTNGRPFLINKKYTLSLGEKATLRHDLESWRGRSFTEDELSGFEVENVIGASALLNVVHKAGSKGGTFANVASVSPLMKGMSKLVPSGDYVRVCDRTPTEPSDDERGDITPSDDEIPFVWLLPILLPMGLTALTLV